MSLPTVNFTESRESAFNGLQQMIAIPAVAGYNQRICCRGVNDAQLLLVGWMIGRQVMQGSNF